MWIPLASANSLKAHRSLSGAWSHLSRRQALIHPLEKYFLWLLAMQKTDPSAHCIFFFLVLSHCPSHPICFARLFSHCSAGAEGLTSCLAPQKPFPHWPHTAASVCFCIRASWTFCLCRGGWAHHWVGADLVTRAANLFLSAQLFFNCWEPESNNPPLS